MPHATSSAHAVTSSGSFVMKSSNHNRDGFTSAYNDLTCPYPHYKDIYTQSSSHDVRDEEFADLSLNDFLVAQRRVAVTNSSSTHQEGQTLFRDLQHKEFPK